jgi:Fe-S oxidoreductase
MTTPAASLPADQALAAERCASCPKMCRAACPTLEVTGNERHQPWGHAVVARTAQRNSDFSSAAVVDSAYACATCSACTPPCKVEGVETPELTWAVRAAVHAQGATPAVGRRMVAAAAEGQVLAGTDPPRWEDPSAALAELRAMATAGAEVLLFPGCGALGRRPGAALAAGRALRALAIPFQVLDEHRCCGMPALTFGDAAALLGMLEAWREVVGARSPRTVVVQSPSCAYLLGVRAGRLGVPVPAAIEPLAVTLAGGLAARGAPLQITAGVTAYHDPCFLSRHQRVRGEPRAALRLSGIAVAELAASGDRAACSGEGGGLSLTHPGIARGYLERLAGAVQASGAERLVTGCSSCAAALEPALPGVDVAELAEAVAAALEAPGAGRSSNPR